MKKVISLLALMMICGIASAAALTPYQTNSSRADAVKEVEAAKGAVLTAPIHKRDTHIDPCTLTQQTKFCTASDGSKTVTQVGSVIGGGILQVTTEAVTK